MTFKRPAPSRGKKLSISPAAEAVKIDYNRQSPIFCLHYVDNNYCITACDREDKASFADRIRRMSRMTWNDLIQAPHHGMGCEKISRQAIHPPIPGHITPDVTFMAFRFSGLKAMVGYRVNATFHIVWFDRDFTVYDYG